MKEGVMAPLLRILRQPAFLVCVVILAFSAVAMRIAADKLEIYLRKEPVPLQKPLGDMDKNKLWPYKFVEAHIINDEAVKESLGAQDNYIQWTLEDTRVTEKDPTRLINLFITYYTGDPDAVPHVPDWCYLGNGWQIMESRNTNIQAPKSVQENRGVDDIRVRVLMMEKTFNFNTYRKPVVYFFGVNNKFACTRDEVRFLANSLRDHHAYFSKVEVDFGFAPVTMEEAVAATEKLMQVVLPVLVEDHWPDWPAVKAAEKRGEAYTPAADKN
ncbi:MAG: hypothetical protein JW709_13185 [Sedimentisphaerales bacterium]|nr:hypothetical protein [Sedimentisphaerales bacterium]